MIPGASIIVICFLVTCPPARVTSLNFSSSSITPSTEYFFANPESFKILSRRDLIHIKPEQPERLQRLTAEDHHPAEWPGDGQGLV